MIFLCTNALYQLGNCYFKGKGKAQDYSKAKRYYEKSASQGDSKAFYKLGILYDKGLGVTKDPNKAILNYISAALKKNYCAIYILAKHYLNGDNCEFNIKKSIKFFTECIETKGENIIQELNGYYNYCINYNYYPANNYLAVIYLTMFDKPDIDLARKYLGETLFGEYPPGQNNFGLFSEIYLKNECNAEEVYKKAAKNKFSLSEFNLGHMYEKCGKLEDSIKYYVQASDHENEPLNFHNRIRNDEELNLSKSFIICLNDLKLVYYFLYIDESNTNYTNARKYFNKVFVKVQTSTSTNHLPFIIKFNNKKYDIYSFIFKSFIELEFINEINDEMTNFLNENDITYTKGKIENLKTKNTKENNSYKNILVKKINYCKNSQFNNLENNPNKIFNSIIKNNHNLIIFSEKLQEFIMLMEKELYTSPYSILFGRVLVNQNEEKAPKIKKLNKNIRDIDKSFYDGFENT